MEYLALHDGMLQQVTTSGDALVLHGEPFKERADPRDRSGVPLGLVTTDHIPSGCLCSWTYTQGKLTLKYSNTACPVLRDHTPSAAKPDRRSERRPERKVEVRRRVL